MESLPYHPFDPRFRQDPYPHYALLRREAPLQRVPGEPWVLVSRHADVRAALRDPATFSSAPMHELISAGVRLAEGHEVDAQTLIGTDPPVHTRLRKIVNRGFLPSRVAALAPRIREIAEGLCARFAARGACELVHDFAAPLPVTVIAELLGIDPSRHEDFKRWSDALVLSLTGRATPDERKALARSLDELDALLDQTFEARRRAPRDDLISALLHAETNEEVMTDRELGFFVPLLLVAGNETTTHLIGNAVVALLRHPEALAAVRAEPALGPALVEETLRWDPPVQLALRRATRDAELPSGKVRQGEALALLLASANRDEAVFENPERFELYRPERPHLAFGHGTHFCVGSHLARLEARIGLEALLPRLEGARLQEPVVEYTATVLIRGPERVGLAFPPAAVEAGRTAGQAAGPGR